ncbi:MAG: bifunctional oligoribonuclease/PAP phosphatase NrnA [Ardenticatenales bacterium]|nr:bifunctional oligoribonuclease/PAP phosphatase NrnA [Ardenticatenales bacterium]
MEQQLQENTESPSPSAIVNRLVELLEQHRGERHVVVLQDYPDPDAIASGWAHRLIAAQYDIDCVLLYAGRISHQQNLALVNLLEVELTRYTDGFDLRQFSGSVFVDNQGTTSSVTLRLSEAHIPPLVIVDHHEIQDLIRAKYTDIRPVGACATLYVEYIRQGLLKLDPKRSEHRRLTTALMHGIQTETNGFIKAHQEEFKAAAFLSDYYDYGLLTEIMSQSRSKSVMEIIRRALENREIRENFSISGIGYVRAEDRDAIPQAADFLLTEENVHTAIVFGLVAGEEEEAVVGSLRTAKVTIDPDELLKSAFGKSRQGQYFGGGKRAAGGFEIPVGFLSGNRDETYQNLKWQVYNVQVKQRFFERLGLSNSSK